MKKKKQINKNDVGYSNKWYFFLFLMFLVLLLRVTYLSLSSEVDGINLKEFASKRTTRYETISAKRGTIYDINGEALAQNVYSYTLIAYLSDSRGEGNYVKDKENTAHMLATVIDMEESEILKLLSKDSYQTEFGNKGKGLTELTKEKIVALNLDGIDFIETQKRYYSKGRFLSYTLGYAKMDEDGNIKGELGLEALYNKELTGTDGYRVYQKDLKGYKIAGTKERVEEAENGYNIYLTIDSSVQFLVEQAIDNIVSNYTFDEVNIVVAEAKTGKILAISTYPSFDPNKRDITNYLDPNVSVAFEPGSTMKIFSYMALMESGKYNGEETFLSGTFTTKDGTEIGDWDRNGWGYITYDKGFAMSSNVGVVNLIDKYFSKEELLAYYKKLGFGSKTGIELANEVSGKLNFKYETEVFNAGFGQGIMTTSIQNIKALTSIANDGILLKPYLVDKITDSDGNIILQNEREEIDRVASHDTVEKIKDLMEDVVQVGTGTPYKMEGYDIIAKTGTAQIASTNGTGYLKGENDVIRGFAGMYPKDDPDIIIYANIKKTSSVTPLAKLVKEVIENMSKIRNNKTVEDTVKITDLIDIKDYSNMNVSNVKTELENKDISVILLGDGENIIDQYPKYQSITNSTKVFLKSNSSNYIMPNIIGYSKKEVLALCNLLGINVTINGYGYVTSQSILENSKIDKNSELVVELKEKF